MSAEFETSDSKHSGQVFAPRYRRAQRGRLRPDAIALLGLAVVMGIGACSGAPSSGTKAGTASAKSASNQGSEDEANSTQGQGNAGSGESKPGSTATDLIAPDGGAQAAPKLPGVPAGELTGGVDLRSAVDGAYPERTRREVLAELTPIWSGHPAPTEFCVAGDNLWIAAGHDAIGSTATLSLHDIRGEQRSTLREELGRVDAVACEGDRILWVERPSGTRPTPSVRSWNASEQTAATLVESKDIAYGFAAHDDAFAYAVPPRERGTLGGAVVAKVSEPQKGQLLAEDIGPIAGLHFAGSTLLMWSKPFTGEDRITLVHADSSLAPFANGKLALLGMSAMGDALTLLVLDDDGRGCRVVRAQVSKGKDATLEPIWHSRERVYGAMIAGERGVFLASSPADETGELVYVPFASGDVVVLAKVARAWRLARTASGVLFEYDLSPDLMQSKRNLAVVTEPPA